MAEPLRIVHAVRSDGFAGVERHVAVLGSAQARAGHDVRIIGGDPERMRAALAGARIRWRPGPTVLAVTGALQRWSDGDVLHVHMTAAEVAATLAWKWWRHPIVATRHFASPRGSSWTGRLAAPVLRRRIAAQIAISEYVAKAIDGGSTVVPTGVPDRELVGSGSRERVVLVAQRFEPEKATTIAVEAFADAALAQAGWRLHLAGDGSERGRLMELAKRLGISHAVEFLGRRADVAERMERAGLLIAPCPVEGFGLTALEAMSSGLPVVAAAAGGHLQTVGLADHAALFPAGDAVAAARELVRLSADDVARTAYGAELQCIQREKFTLDAQVAATDAVYRSVL